MDKGFIVFLLIAVITVMISAVSQMMKNAQAPAPRPQNRPRPASEDIDRFLQEIDRLRKKREEPSEPPVASPVVARPVQRPIPVADTPPPLPPSPRKVSRLSEQSEFVPSQVTRPARTVSSTLEPEQPASSPSSLPDKAATPSPSVRVDDVAATPPSASAYVRTTAKAPATTREAPTPQQAAFTGKLQELFTSPGSLPLGIIMHELLSPPRCRRRPGT